MFDWLVRDGVGKAVDLSVQFGSDRFDAQALKRIDQRMGEAVQPVAVFQDAFALYVVENFANLLWREFVVIQKRDETDDSPLEVNVVLPQRIVGVDEEGLGGQAALGS
jgi:hypothetical protein